MGNENFCLEEELLRLWLDRSSPIELRIELLSKDMPDNYIFYFIGLQIATHIHPNNSGHYSQSLIILKYKSPGNMMTSVLFLIPEKQNMSEFLLLYSQTPLLHSFHPLFSVEYILATNLPNGLSAINSC